MTKEEREHFEQAHIDGNAFCVGNRPAIGWMLMANIGGGRMTIRVDDRNGRVPSYAQPTVKAARALAHWILANTTDA